MSHDAIEFSEDVLGIFIGHATDANVLVQSVLDIETKLQAELTEKLKVNAVRESTPYDRWSCAPLCTARR